MPLKDEVFFLSPCLFLFLSLPGLWSGLVFHHCELNLSIISESGRKEAKKKNTRSVAQLGEQVHSSEGHSIQWCLICSWGPFKLNQYKSSLRKPTERGNNTCKAPVFFTDVFLGLIQIVHIKCFNQAPLLNPESETFPKVTIKKYAALAKLNWSTEHTNNHTGISHIYSFCNYIMHTFPFHHFPPTLYTNGVFSQFVLLCSWYCPRVFSRCLVLTLYTSFCSVNASSHHAKSVFFSSVYGD